MKLVIKRSVAQDLSAETKKALGKLLPDYWSYKKVHDLDLVGRKPKEIDRIEKAFKQSEGRSGVNLILRDIKRWREAQQYLPDIVANMLQSHYSLHMMMHGGAAEMRTAVTIKLRHPPREPYGKNSAELC